MDADTLMRRLTRPPFANVEQFCGNEENPGRDEVPEWQVFTYRSTTPDQLSIEEQLEHLITRSSSILHIGVGNSSLGKRFAPRVEFIRGITIHDEERMFANNLAIVNYIVTTNSKYSANIASFTEKFDFIVDNNPSTFACCLFHFCTMLISYKKLLRDGGEILTAEPGLSCEGSTGDPNWSLRWADWAYLGGIIPLTTVSAATR